MSRVGRSLRGLGLLGDGLRLTYRAAFGTIPAVDVFRHMQPIRPRTASIATSLQPFGNVAVRFHTASLSSPIATTRTNTKRLLKSLASKNIAMASRQLAEDTVRSKVAFRRAAGQYYTGQKGTVGRSSRSAGIVVRPTNCLSDTIKHHS